MVKGLSLRDVKCYWKNGKLKRDGRLYPIDKTRAALRAKHKKLYGHQKNYRELTDTEIDWVIYNDPSKSRNSPSGQAKVLKKTKLKLEREIKTIELKKVQEERLLLKMQIEEQNKEVTEAIRQAYDIVTPESCSIVGYSRMQLPLVICAVLHHMPGISEYQAKLIIGNWVKKGYL